MRRPSPWTPGVLDRAPEHVRRCLRWQLDPFAHAAGATDPVAAKAVWVGGVTTLERLRAGSRRTTQAR